MNLELPSSIAKNASTALKRNYWASELMVRPWGDARENCWSDRGIWSCGSRFSSGSVFKIMWTRTKSRLEPVEPFIRLTSWVFKKLISHLYMYFWAKTLQVFFTFFHLYCKKGKIFRISWVLAGVLAGAVRLNWVVEFEVVYWLTWAAAQRSLCTVRLWSLSSWATEIVLGGVAKNKSCTLTTVTKPLFSNSGKFTLATSPQIGCDQFPNFRNQRGKAGKHATGNGNLPFCKLKAIESISGNLRHFFEVKKMFWAMALKYSTGARSSVITVISEGSSVW